MKNNIPQIPKPKPKLKPKHIKERKKQIHKYINT
jgi:hypothetical protein